MCIALWALDREDYALILCNNRDELLHRPTLDAQFHNFGHEDRPKTVLSGLDVEAGGTWFGINQVGKIALLTNISEPRKVFEHSRGYLTSSFLLSDDPIPLKDEIDKIVLEDAKYAGFNLLLLAPAHASWDSGGLLRFDSLMVTNRGSGGAITSRALASEEKHCGCVSNAVGNANSEWPKVQHALHDFDTVMNTLVEGQLTEDELVERLFRVLSWISPESVTERSQLRNTVRVQPFPITLEGLENVEPYATRLSTILLIRKNGEALFIERDIWKIVDRQVVQGDPTSQRTFRFQLQHNVGT